MKLIEFKNQDGAILRGILRVGTANCAVIFSHGLERTSITEQKFKRLADVLEKKSVTSFAFDYTGTGLSDGDFSGTTVVRMVDDFLHACEVLKKETGVSDIVAVGHSISGCILGTVRKTTPQLLSKIVLLGPGLNMREILRLKFTRDFARISGLKEQITWQNFREFFNEELFQTFCKQTNNMLRSNVIGTDFFRENMDTDYSSLFTSPNDDVLLIHGTADEMVPIESLNVQFINKIIISKGDHELERPDVMAQWLDPCVEFLLK